MIKIKKILVPTDLSDAVLGSTAEKTCRWRAVPC